MTIAFVGLSGALKRTRACDVRLAMFANMMSENNHVMVINRYSPLHEITSTNIRVADSVEQNEIIKPRNTGRIATLLLLIASVLAEPFFLLYKNHKERIDIIHIYSGHYFDYLLYKLVAKIIGAKVVCQYVEYRYALESRALYHRINNYLCDMKGPKLWDGVIAISAFLMNAAVEVNNRIKAIRIPPICDFSLYQSIHGNVDIGSPYILYCGSVGYMDVIEMILDSYRQSTINETHKLVLVLGGSLEDISVFEEKNRDVIVKHNIEYNDLIRYYKNATLLLIPLRDSIRDIARFPNKICEYLAANGVIVTTDVGEMSSFFSDGESAIIASDYSVESFKIALDKFVEGGYDYSKIKQNSYLIGLKYFDIISVKDQIEVFLRCL